jgi:hypothetical protein
MPAIKAGRYAARRRTSAATNARPVPMIRLGQLAIISVSDHDLGLDYRRRRVWLELVMVWAGGLLGVASMAWPRPVSACFSDAVPSLAVLDWFDSWHRRCHRRDYRAGVY